MEPGGPGAEAGAEGAAGDPYRRPARRTQWLLSALAHHYGLDRGVENEIVVLATGLDQYLQEVFHHLDCRGAGRLPRADFRALCAVLGLRGEGAPAGGAAGGAPGRDPSPAGAGAAADPDADAEEEARLALSAEPPELTFRQFHARLCGYFGTRAGPRLPRGALSEHIETQIRLRGPRRRRRRAPRAPGPEGGAAGERLAQLEEENGSLRELVEDLRAALQSSDARCLALQVGLWKSQKGALEVGRAEPEAAGRAEPEAVARELRRTQDALAAAEARAGRLSQGQAEVRRRAEEARQAVLRSLSRVRELELLARQVPGLRHWVRRLEGELQRCRSEGTQLPTSARASPGPDASRGDADSEPPGPEAAPESSSGSRPSDEADEQLFRSVEGQAASDEEGEDQKWHEGQGPPEVRVLLGRLSSLGSGCDDQTAAKLMACFGPFGGAEHARTLGELEARVTSLAEQLQTQGRRGTTTTTGLPEEEAALQRKAEENERLRLELQMVETERVRLSLLEEKLVDVLQLLQRLRDLNISKRALGKILLSTLAACGDPAHAVVTLGCRPQSCARASSRRSQEGSPVQPRSQPARCPPGGPCSCSGPRRRPPTAAPSRAPARFWRPWGCGWTAGAGGSRPCPRCPSTRATSCWPTTACAPCPRAPSTACPSCRPWTPRRTPGAATAASPTCASG